MPEMEQIMKSVATEDHGKYDCLVICVLSHGKQRTVYGTDGHTIALDDIISYYHARSCPTLAGKPKLFFIQACQGTQKHKGIIQVRYELVYDKRGLLT